MDGSNIISRNTLDLKNPYFRYSGGQSSPPPGSNTTSPTDTYWSSIPNNVGTMSVVNHELATGGVLNNGVVNNPAAYGMGGINPVAIPGNMHDDILNIGE